MTYNRINRGLVAEMMVALKLTELGYVVSLPVSHGSVYDIVVDTGSSMRKIQVKRAYTVKVGSKDILKVETCRIVGSKPMKYKEGDYDVLVAVDVSGSNFWIMPYQAIKHYSRQIELRVNTCGRFFNDWSLI